MDILLPKYDPKIKMRCSVQLASFFFFFKQSLYHRTASYIYNEHNDGYSWSIEGISTPEDIINADYTLLNTALNDKLLVFSGTSNTTGFFYVSDLNNKTNSRIVFAPTDEPLFSNLNGFGYSIDVAKTIGKNGISQLISVGVPFATRLLNKQFTSTGVFFFANSYSSIYFYLITIFNRLFFFTKMKLLQKETLIGKMLQFFMPTMQAVTICLVLVLE